MVSEVISSNSGLVTSISNLAGASEPAIRLLLTVLSGYPISAFYRCFLVGKTTRNTQNIFFVCCGLALCYFNYGIDTYHSLLSVLATFIILRLLLHRPYLLLRVNFIFHMSYLLIGYLFTESNNYDILWTMPHCVLVLRMIGLGFDVADGQKPRETLSKDQLATALSEPPSFLELASFSYFPCSFLVGPQYSFRRYKRFISGEFCSYEGATKSGIERMLLGFLYLLLNQLGAIIFPDEYVLSNNFKYNSFVFRIYYIGIWGKLSLYKYISCWLLAEGAIICIGLSYNGKNIDNKDDWSGCSNVKLKVFELGTCMQHYVQSFNVNTNNWVAQYIYKRLKFLNNRMMSYAGALCFLAVWHGFHSGYYLAFLLEFLIVTAEKQFETVYKNVIEPKYGSILEQSIILKTLTWTILKLYNVIYMGWCLIPFIFFDYIKWIRVFASVNYFGFYVLAVWFAVYFIYIRMFSDNKKGVAQDRLSTIQNKKND